MSRLDDVIKQVKYARNGKHKSWIFDDNGNVKDNVLCGDVLPLLEELKEYEINVSDEWIEKFRKDAKGANTYNWNANISNDVEMRYRENCGVILLEVHLFGDIRAGYSDYFAVKFDEFDDLFYLDSVTQIKYINDRFCADINIFTEGYNVYDAEMQKDVGEFYDLEIEDLLREIA